MKDEAHVAPASVVPPRRAVWLLAYRSSIIALLLLMLLALAVRLLVWRWREFYDLGGDEREYLAQALTLLQTHQYTELRLMRPPIYTFFLAASIQLVDSLVQNLRLVQAFLSAFTVVPMWLLAQTMDDRRWTMGESSPSISPTVHRPSSMVATVACLLLALSYTLAANATELLSETLFFFGLTTVFWLLLRTARLSRLQSKNAWRWAAAAGLSVGLLCLVRSVAQPLIPLGALWLLFQTTDDGRRTTEDGTRQGDRETGRQGDRETGRQGDKVLKHHASRITHHASRITSRVSCIVSCTFLICCLLPIVPWTVRNYVTYGALIVVDTTGAENLWLDNNPAASTADDPLGREDAKRQLYALGDDRAARQRLASQRGIEAITSRPDWFIPKAYGELLKFFALEYADDLRARPVIWHPPADVWMRLVLGDALWLLLLFGGIAGIVLVETRDTRQETGRHETRDRKMRSASRSSFILHPSSFRDPRFLFVPWVLYIVLTAMIFHVELRYRLPVYPVLIGYTALVVVRLRKLAWRPVRVGVALFVISVCTILTLLHAPYPVLAWQLGWKQYHLGQAERALATSDSARAETEAQAVVALDAESALAQVALARTALLRGDTVAAQGFLQTAINLKEAHPYAHLLLGDLQRTAGQDDVARQELVYETRSLEDLQGWTWSRFHTPSPARLDVGGGLDLGFVEGFYPAEKDGWRWTKDRAHLRLHAAPDSTMLRLRLASGRPSEAPVPILTVLIDGRAIGKIDVAQDWSIYTLPLTSISTERDLVVELVADTFAPRSYNRTSGDGRTLGVMLDWAEVGR